MAKICALNSWEGDRLLEKGTQPICSHHRHIPIAQAEALQSQSMGFFIDETHRRFVVDDARAWRVIGITWQHVRIAKRGGGRQPASQHKTKFPQRAQGSNGIPRVTHAAAASIG